MVRQTIRKISSGCAVKLKAGSQLTDRLKQTWLLGNPIAAGGFGDIYSASRDFRKSMALCVAKVEAHSSGPLFVELNFFLRVGKESYIEEYKKANGLRHLGMPHLIAFGSHTANNIRYRFLILNRYGPDIWSFFLKNERKFSLKSTLAIGLQIIDVLEYIHYFGYTHADIKGSNMVTGLGRGGENRVYLIDFGLSCLYVNGSGEHKEFAPDMRRAHDGTLEYTSRDAHLGGGQCSGDPAIGTDVLTNFFLAHSRRGDIETLGYNLVQWLCGELPWESDLDDPDTVAAAKNLYFSNISLFMHKCFPRGRPPDVIIQYLAYVANLQFTTAPDYTGVRQMLRDGMKQAGLADDGKLQLLEPVTSQENKEIKRFGRNMTENWRRAPKQMSQRSVHADRKACAPVQANGRHTRLKSKLMSKEFDWIKVLQSNPERVAKTKLKKSKRRDVTPPPVIVDLHESMMRNPESPRENPTPAMLALLRIKKSGRRPTRRCPQLDISSVSSPYVEPLTPAMEEVIRQRVMRGGSYQPKLTAMAARAERSRMQQSSTVDTRLRTRKPINYREISPQPDEFLETSDCENFENGRRTRQSAHQYSLSRRPITRQYTRRRGLERLVDPDEPSPTRTRKSRAGGPVTPPSKSKTGRSPPAPRKRSLASKANDTPVTTRVTRGQLARLALDLSGASRSKRMRQI